MKYFMACRFARMIQKRVSKWIEWRNRSNVAMNERATLINHVNANAEMLTAELNSSTACQLEVMGWQEHESYL